MIRLLGTLIVVFACLLPDLSAARRRKPTSFVKLDGKKVRVRWGDGDTFRLVGKRGRRAAARLKGYNTLENYGPVHRWGKWKAWQLYLVGNRATRVARSRVWKCYTLPGSGGYGRRLVKCPGLARRLIRLGLAHVFSMGGPGPRKMLAIQHWAQRKRRGIWKKGVPRYIVTSVHSKWPGRRRRVYNRLISTRTGATKRMFHRRTYRTCRWICAGGSCMLFVPYRERYGWRKARCIRLN